MTNQKPIIIANEREKPVLVFMVGRPAVGKSFFASKLMPYVLDMTYVNKDTINNTFLTLLALPGALNTSFHSADESMEEYAKKNIGRCGHFRIMVENLASGNGIERDSPIYVEHIRLQSYLMMQTLARDQLNSGKSVLLDAPHLKEVQMGFGEYFGPRGVVNSVVGDNLDLKALLCTAPEEVILERMKARAKKRDDYMFDEAVFRKDLEREPIRPRQIEDYDYIEIDTTGPIEENIKKTLEFLIK